MSCCSEALCVMRHRAGIVTAAVIIRSRQLWLGLLLRGPSVSVFHAILCFLFFFCGFRVFSAFLDLFSRLSFLCCFTRFAMGRGKKPPFDSPRQSLD